MSNSFPPVGVDLVALGAADFAQALTEANKRMLQSQEYVKGLVAQLSLISPTNIKAQQSIAILTAQFNALQLAYAKMVVANTQGVPEQEAAAKAFNDTAEAIQKTVGGLNELTSVGPKATTSMGTALRDARGARDALFAFGLALNLVTTELGSQLPPAAQKAASSIKIVADTMLAGAYFGGIAGAAIGALAGVLLSVGATALSIDPQIKALNDSLDKLGKKDDATQGLAKLANVNLTNAAAALEFLKANQDLAESFGVSVSAAQPAIPVLQGVGDAFRAVGDTLGLLERAYEALFPQVVRNQQAIAEFFKQVQGGVSGTTVFLETLAQGGNAFDAVVKGAEAAKRAHDGDAAALDALNAKTLEYARIQNYLNSTAAQNTIASQQQTIDKLKLEGASIEQLIPEYYKLLKAKQDAASYAGTGAGKLGTNAPINPSDVGAAIAGGANDLSFLNDTATKLAKDLLNIQRQYNDDSAALSEDHARRLDEIGSNAYEQQVRMERDLVRRLTEIRAQYNQDVTDAGTDYATRLADLESNAQESRTKIAEDYADKRAKIEQDYQDKVKQIQEDYAASLFDIVAKDDAKGLVRARLARDKALADAAKTRDKENADADKQKAKQEKDLQDSLDKQKRQLEQDYERRLRDLAQSFEKQTASAQQNYRDQLADLTDATARQYAAENAAYARSQKALDKANADKKQALIDALIEIKGVNDQYGQAIIDSLKRILDPATIIQLTNDLQKAFDTKIEIKVTPNASSVGSNGLPIEERTFAEGGYIANTQRALVHAGETVLPAQNAQRAYELASQHLARVSMPLSRRYMGSSNSGGGSIKLYIDNSINSALLSSQIRAESIGIAVDIVKRARS